MMYPLVRELAEDGIPVTVTCRVLHFTPQAYYKWKTRPVSHRDAFSPRTRWGGAKRSGKRTVP